MRRLFIRLKSRYEAFFIRLNESQYDFIRFNIGSNSVAVPFILALCAFLAFYFDVLNADYLKGMDHDLSFFIGLFSILLGVGFYSFWNLNGNSVYSFHFIKTKLLPKNVIEFFSYKGFSFGIARNTNKEASELRPVTMQILSILIFLNLSLITLDNRGFNIIKEVPSRILEPSHRFCPDEEAEMEDAPVKQGCALIIKAYKLGYAKDLGPCEPKKVDPEKMKLCKLRRKDEPFFHYVGRLLFSSVTKIAGFFSEKKFEKMEKKFKLQLDNLEPLRDYKKFAISASPRSSHHIWTDLPYPEEDLLIRFKEFTNPSYCLEKYQKQTNTLRMEEDDTRKNSKLLEHVFGHLLFDPKIKRTVGFCKEYEIHWDAAADICRTLAANPNQTMKEEGILSPIELVLKRYDIVNTILDLDEEIEKLESQKEKKTAIAELQKTDKSKKRKKQKKVIDTSKIAKDKAQLRKKNELISFQCYMQSNDSKKKDETHTFTFDNTKFTVQTHYFPLVEGRGASHVSMYKNFAKLLESSFHYSQYTSRSNVAINTQESKEKLIEDTRYALQQSSFLMSKLEMLKDIDIFLGNNWIFEREDLLEVYPFHLHLQNYIESFRVKYEDNRGRL